MSHFNFWNILKMGRIFYGILSMTIYYLFLLIPKSAHTEILIDNPFLPWEISGSEDCNKLWNPDGPRIKLGDYAVIEDSFEASRTFIEAVAITANYVSIKWSLIAESDGNAQTRYGNISKNDFIIYTHDRQSGRLIATQSQSGRVQERDKSLSVSCHQGPVNKVNLKMLNRTYETDFYRFTAITKINETKAISTVDQVFIWANSSVTLLFSILQIAQPYPNLVCSKSGAVSQSRCQAEIYLKTIRIIEAGNRFNLKND